MEQSSWEINGCSVSDVPSHLWNPKINRHADESSQPPGIPFLHIFVCIMFVFRRFLMGEQRSTRKVLVGKLEG
jgi:hypothetical protein